MRAPLGRLCGHTVFYTEICGCIIHNGRQMENRSDVSTAVEYSFTHKNKNIDKWCDMMNYANWKKLVTEDHTYYVWFHHVRFSEQAN